ncbi:MAG: DUF5688 family protein [Roseburia sp.]|nr:DUF5688 family protein [Roseburia sp.]
MEFTSFTGLIKDEVERRVGGEYRISIRDVMKNNGVVLCGLTLRQDDSNISPTIYLNAYYDAYQNGQTTLGGIVDEVLELYERNRVNRSIDMRKFLDYEAVRHRIVYKLINTEQNRELLQDIPHIAFHDLSIVFQFLITEECFGSATILIHNAHLKIWNVSVTELYKRARQNTPILNKYEIKSMSEVLCELSHGGGAAGGDEKAQIPLYVLSNRSRVHGAACMLYPDLLKDFAEAMGQDIYIIPSSVHEVLLLPADSREEVAYIKEMIQEVNDTQVNAEEVLSYSVYFYARGEGKVRML